MKPTDILMQEHRVIEQVLDCLSVIARNADASGKLDLESAQEAIDFFSNFADKCHHGKEEDCLFPLLERKGFVREQGPTGVMLHEHELGRRHVRGMKEATSAVADGNAAATSSFVAHAREFVELLRQHIQKEDHCLFQMTNQTLSEAEQSQLMQSFEQVEHDDMGPGTHERYLQLASRLAARCGVEDRAADSTTSECSPCCHHHGAKAIANH